MVHTTLMLVRVHFLVAGGLILDSAEVETMHHCVQRSS